MEVTYSPAIKPNYITRCVVFAMEIRPFTQNTVSANRTNTARPPFSPSARQVPRHPSCPVPSQRIAAQRAPVPPDRAIPQAPPTSSPHRVLGDSGIIGTNGEPPTQKSLSDATPSIDGDKFRILRFICQSQSLTLLFSSKPYQISFIRCQSMPFIRNFGNR